jgi:hypothetical protein
MSDERKIENVSCVVESDVDAQQVEFLQNLRELMGWYGKSAGDVMVMLQAEPSLGEVRSSSINAPLTVH